MHHPMLRWLYRLYEVLEELFMSKDSVFLFFKFGTHKWMKKLTEGVLSFSCTGNFIYQATHTDNDIQGDKLEGVFARLKTDDPRILQMECELGKDLEIIPDNDAFVLLRRKSSKYRPIFCLYSYADQDVLDDCSSPAPGVQSVKHTFDSKMYTGFSDTFEARNVVVPELRFAQVTLAKSETFLMRLKIALNALELKHKVDYVNYTEFEKETFFIPPTEKYNELFYKFPKYKHQHEVRICLTGLSFSHIGQRFDLDIGELSDGEYKLTHTPFYFISEVIMKRK